MSADKDGAYWSRLERVLEALAPAESRPTSLRFALRHLFERLATTSVGQEGLDFHTWCARVLHWDLPSNPLDLEQREGRIQRHAGLAVRRRLALLLKDRVLEEVRNDGVSPSTRLAALADAELGTDDGLSPWWILPQARVKRHIFERPFGRDAVRYRVLREQRFLYRLALGQPNQEDLLELLAKSDQALKAVLQDLTLDLSPYRHSRK